MIRPACVAVLFLATTALAQPVGVDLLKQQAAALQPHAESDLARAFLDAVPALPRIEPRLLHRDGATGEWFTEAQAAALPEERRAALKAIPADESRYYNTKYGSPLMYARALDVLAKHGVTSLGGKRVMDYGYGTVGHLRLLAALGADVVGVDVDPFLATLYSEPSDVGPVPPASAGAPGGSIKLVTGSWPGKVADEVGAGFDVIVSKNTLKLGYIHPRREVDAKFLVDLGATDEEYLAAVHDTLKPGGVVLIYNLSPTQSPPDQAYKPHADGQCPFSRQSVAAAGFEILAFDEPDDDAARAMFDAVEYPTTAPDGSPDLFAWYTVLRRK